VRGPILMQGQASAEFNKDNKTGRVDRWRPSSYDSLYEHSLEHWLDLQRLVDEADGDSPFAFVPPR
jgi:hypothetical protein